MPEMVGYLVCKRNQLGLSTSLGPEAMLAFHQDVMKLFNMFHNVGYNYVFLYTCEYDILYTLTSFRNI